MNIKFMISTTMEIPGWKIVDYCGLVRGLVVRSPTISQGIMGGLKQLVGGNIESYKVMCSQARDQAETEMIGQAIHFGANAVVGFMVDATDVGGGQSSATEILCMGTAVKVVRIQ